MTRTAIWTLCFCLAAASVARADTVLVDEDFESYADTAALTAVWALQDPEADLNAQLVDENFETLTTLDDVDPQPIGSRAFPNGGQGVEHRGGTVLEYQPLLGATGTIAPSATQSIVLQVDIYDVAITGNKRLTVGLRSNAPENIVELGQYNNPSGYVYRAALFPTVPTEPNPSWQAFELPLEYDREDDSDNETDELDLGEDWHTWRATITPDDITFQIDLFRDGLDAQGSPGWDVTVTEPVTTGANGFDSLRFGGPSNFSSAGNLFYGGSIFDNILLSLVDVETGAGLVGDYNSDDRVDALDYAIWRESVGDSVPNGTGADGNGNGVIDAGDFTEWLNNFGATQVSVAPTQTPEPTGAAAALVALVLAGGTRRRQ